MSLRNQNPDQKTCSVVVRAFNEEKHIGRLLDGIAQQNISNIELILVDSGSTDNTVPIVKKYDAAFPIRILHIQPDEFTFGRSLNLGISHSQADHIAIVSAHIYPVYPDWLENLLAPFADDTVVLTYGKQRGDATTKFSEHQIFSHWYPGQSTSRQEHPFCNNANAVIRRETWQEQPYDESLSGLEDLAWANWAIEQGYAIAYSAEAEVIHVHNETSHEVYNRYRREAMAFKRIFPHESFAFWDFIRLVTSNISSDLWHAAQQRILFQTMGSIFWFRWMQFRGTYKGYREAGPLTWRLRKTFYYPSGIRLSAQPGSRTVEPIQYNEEPETFD